MQKQERQFDFEIEAIVIAIDGCQERMIVNRLKNDPAAKALGDQSRGTGFPGCGQTFDGDKHAVQYEAESLISSICADIRMHRRGGLHPVRSPCAPR
jgi:hypothetical protein